MQATAGQEHRYEIRCGLMILKIEYYRRCVEIFQARTEPAAGLSYRVHPVRCLGLEKRQREKYGEEEKYRSALEANDQFPGHANPKVRSSLVLCVQT